VSWNNRGCIHIRERRLPEAVADLRQALALCATDPHYHNNLGVALQLTGDVDSALVAYGCALRIDSEAANFYSNRGFAHHLNGDLEAALRDLDRAIKLRSDYTKAYYQRAHVRSQLGDKAGAEEDFDRYAKLIVSEEGGVAPDNGPTIVAR
jgi:Flp pilus assembly protein TadD